MLPVSHSATIGPSGPGSTASKHPRSCPRQFLAGPSIVHCRLCNSAMNSFFIGPTPLPSSRFFPLWGWMVNILLPGGHTHFFTASWIDFLVLDQCLDLE